MIARLSRPCDQMTVGALRAALAEISDDVPVAVFGNESLCDACYQALSPLTSVCFDDGLVSGGPNYVGAHRAVLLDVNP